MPMTTSPSIHPSKDVNHAGSWERGHGRRTSFSAGVECNCASHGNSLHFATALPVQRRRPRAIITPTLPLSLRNSDVRESMLHQFCLNQLESTKEFLFGSASFRFLLFPLSRLPLIFNLRSTLGRNGIRNLFRLCNGDDDDVSLIVFPETSRSIWERFLVGIVRGSFSLFSLPRHSRLSSAIVALSDLRTNDAAIITLFAHLVVVSLLLSGRPVLVIKNSRNIAAAAGAAALTRTDADVAPSSHRFHLPKCVIARPRPEETLLERARERPNGPRNMLARWDGDDVLVGSTFCLRPQNRSESLIPAEISLAVREREREASSISVEICRIF